MKRLLVTLALTFSPLACAATAPLRGNLDESKVAPYTLPDVLLSPTRTPLRDPTAWRANRPALLELFAREVYGRTPSGRPAALRWETTATVSAYYGDLCPDHVNGLAESVGALFATGTTEKRAPDAWGAIGVWAWGLSRALDVLAADREIDATRVAVHGHSRLGKAALWAGAQDERFAAVISNDSGAGGAALSKRDFGETVAMLNQNFPFWFALNFRRYDAREADLPVDQHQLLALIAPRPFYVASASEDLHADPKGEFLAAKHTEPVYALFSHRGLGVDAPPAPDTPVGDRIGYHLRTGAHDILAYDWEQYLNFADRHLK